MLRQDKAISGSTSKLRAEAAEAPTLLVGQGKALERPIGELVARLQSKPPRLVVTCARGSSAHAATFGKHLFERHLGIPVCAAAPVIASIYGRRLALKDQLFVSISQSGRSADIIAMAAMARASGATTVAIVNDAGSPLARACELVLPIEAGPELSIAATKSFIATLTVLLRLTAAWTDNTEMRAAIERLPERLTSATEVDWSAALPSLSDARSAMTIGRGPTLAIAREAALKLKEVCNLHAEAFSGAEFQHGPIALVESDLSSPYVHAGRPGGRGIREAQTRLGSQRRLGICNGNVGCQTCFSTHVEPGSSRRRRCLLDPHVLPIASPRRRAPWLRRRSTPSFEKGDGDQMKAPRCFAVTADRVFDGTTWHEHSAVVIEGSQIQQIVSRIETPAIPITISARGHLACSWIYRHPGQWRRRRAFQRLPDRRNDFGDRGGASQVRHDGFLADADN